MTVTQLDKDPLFEDGETGKWQQGKPGGLSPTLLPSIPLPGGRPKAERGSARRQASVGHCAISDGAGGGEGTEPSPFPQLLLGSAQLSSRVRASVKRQKGGGSSSREESMACIRRLLTTIF